MENNNIKYFSNNSIVPLPSAKLQIKLKVPKELVSTRSIIHPMYILDISYPNRRQERGSMIQIKAANYNKKNRRLGMIKQPGGASCNQRK